MSRKSPVRGYYRRSFMRKGGIKVRGAYVRPHRARLLSSGKSRGIKSPGRYSAKKGYSRWIKKQGKLGGSGFLTKFSRYQQKTSLDRCVGKYGYRSCLGSLLILKKPKNRNMVFEPVINDLVRYMKRKHKNDPTYY
jgi:hypothetical protein